MYPGMRDALIAAMLAAQVEMDSFKHGFELFGADFMLSEDMKYGIVCTTICSVRNIVFYRILFSKK